MGASPSATHAAIEGRNSAAPESGRKAAATKGAAAAARATAAEWPARTGPSLHLYELEHRVGPGDMVVIPAGEPHCHGATRESAMTHLAFGVPGTTDVVGGERYIPPE